MDEYGTVELEAEFGDDLGQIAAEIAALRRTVFQVRAEQVRLMRWKRRWDELAGVLEDPENTFGDADQVLEAMDAMESGVNPDDA